MVANGRSVVAVTLRIVLPDALNRRMVSAWTKPLVLVYYMPLAVVLPVELPTIEHHAHAQVLRRTRRRQHRLVTYAVCSGSKMGGRRRSGLAELGDVGRCQGGC